MNQQCWIVCQPSTLPLVFSKCLLSGQHCLPPASSKTFMLCLVQTLFTLLHETEAGTACDDITRQEEVLFQFLCMKEAGTVCENFIKIEK